MRILRVIHSMNPATGGPCQGLRNLIPELERRDCANEVVCLENPSAPFLGNDPFPVHAIGEGTGPLQFHSGLLPWLKAHQGSFDAIIVHGLWLWPGIAVWLASRRRPRDGKASQVPPYFVMPHGMLDPWFQSEQRGWKRMRDRMFWHLIQHRVIRDSAGLLFTCRREMELARSAFASYRPPREIEVGYGIPTPPSPSESMMRAFLGTCPALSKDAPFLLFLGRIHPKKGVDLLIRSYAELHGGTISSGEKISRLVIAGPIDSDHAQQMIRLAESLIPCHVFSPVSGSKFPAPVNDDSGPGIHFTGMLAGDAKWGALHSCEAFVLPSHQENFGIAVAEALACGKPVLISDQVNTAPEIVSSGAGFVAEDNPSGTRCLLKRWRMTPAEEKTRMAGNALACFTRNFHAEAAAERFLREIGPLISKSR